jgi:hypothetical protein
MRRFGAPFCCESMKGGLALYRHRRVLLRARRERPRRRGTDERDELAPSHVAKYSRSRCVSGTTHERRGLVFQAPLVQSMKENMPPVSITTRATQRQD